MEESRLLTEPEIDAALQLIQLSGDSDSAAAVRCSNGGGGYAKRARRGDECGGEESVGDTAEICSSSASAVNINVVIGRREDENNLDGAEQGWLSRKRRFRSVVELYRVTSPVMIKATKRSKKANKK
nr:hypothetical protein A4A49_03103 [Ipomoea batatas]GME13732.1 hypothetical protein A4A49_03103 [Ipomoea batatas]